MAFLSRTLRKLTTTPGVNVCAVRHFSKPNHVANTIYTEHTVAGSERTPNTKLAVLPVYLNGQKYDTRLTGVEVIPNAKEILCALYAKGIKMAEDYGTETYFNQFAIDQMRFRWDVVLKHEEIHKIEDELALGQIEQLVQYAKDDVEMIYYYNEVLVPAHGPNAPPSPLESTEEENDDDVMEGEGRTLTLENWDQVMAEIDAEEPDVDEEKALQDNIAFYDELARLKLERKEKMEKEAAETHEIIKEMGGGFRMGSMNARFTEKHSS